MKQTDKMHKNFENFRKISELEKGKNHLQMAYVNPFTPKIWL